MTFSISPLTPVTPTASFSNVNSPIQTQTSVSVDSRSKTQNILAYNNIKAGLFHYAVFNSQLNDPIDFKVEGSYIVTTNQQEAGSVCLVFDSQTKKLLHKLEGHNCAITCLYAHEGKIYSGDLEGTIKVWDANTGKELASLTNPADQKHQHSLRISFMKVVDDKLIAGSYGGQDNQAIGVMRVWDIRNFKELNTICHKGVALADANSDVIVTGFPQIYNSIDVWNMDGHHLFDFSKRFIQVESLKVLKNELITLNAYSTFYVWDYNTGACKKTFTITDLTNLTSTDTMFVAHPFVIFSGKGGWASYNRETDDIVNSELKDDVNGICVENGVVFAYCERYEKLFMSDFKSGKILAKIDLYKIFNHPKVHVKHFDYKDGKLYLQMHEPKEALTTLAVIDFSLNQEENLQKLIENLEQNDTLGFCNAFRLLPVDLQNAIIEKFYKQRGFVEKINPAMTDCFRGFLSDSKNQSPETNLQRIAAVKACLQ